MDLFAAVVRRDGRACGELLVARARHHECDDIPAFCDDVDGLVRRATAATAAGAGATLEELDVARLLFDVLAVCRRHRVRLEANFATTVVAITIVEGIGRQLDPTIDLLREAAPYVCLADTSLTNRGDAAAGNEGIGVAATPRGSDDEQARACVLERRSQQIVSALVDSAAAGDVDIPRNRGRTDRDRRAPQVRAPRGRARAFWQLVNVLFLWCSNRSDGSRRNRSTTARRGRRVHHSS